MARAVLVVLLVSVACRTATDESTLPFGRLGEAHAERRRPVAAAPPASDRGRVQHHMRALLDDLRGVERTLAVRRLDEARALAFMLSRPVNDPRLEPFAAEYARVSTAALALARATSFDEAYRLAPRVIEACAGCHARAGVEVAELDAMRTRTISRR